MENFITQLLESEFLKGLIVDAVQSGAGMAIAYWLVGTPIVGDWLKKAGDWLLEKIGVGGSEITRYAALILGTGVSLCIYYIGVGFGYMEAPTNLEAFLTLAIKLGTLNFTGTQIIHARRELNERDRLRKALHERGPAQAKLLR